MNADNNGAGKNSPHLSVTGVSKRFGGVEALKGVEFNTQKGEVTALVGDNGAGKSTLIKILAGAMTPDNGEFKINGEKVEINNPHDAANLGIQIVYQDLALCENLDVSANLSLGTEPTKNKWGAWMLPKKLRPIDELEMEQKAKNAIKQLEVKTLASVRAKVGGLSGGQRQAIAIARAVGTKGEILLLDEPTAALGVAQTRQVLDVVKRLRDTNYAVVYISHNLTDVFEVADKICVLRQGTNAGTYNKKNTKPDEIIAAMTQGLQEN